MSSFDIIFFTTGEYMGVSRQFTVMTALLKDVFLWLITEDVLMLLCSEVGQGKLGQICLGISMHRHLQTGSTNTHCTMCDFSHHMQSQGVTALCMPWARTGKMYQ